MNCNYHMEVSQFMITYICVHILRIYLFGIENRLIMTRCCQIDRRTELNRSLAASLCRWNYVSLQTSSGA